MADSDEEYEECLHEEQERRVAEQEAFHLANNGESVTLQDRRGTLWAAAARRETRIAVEQLAEHERVLADAAVRTDQEARLQDQEQRARYGDVQSLHRHAAV